MTANVTTCRKSETENVRYGGTKKKSKARTLRTRADDRSAETEAHRDDDDAEQVGHHDVREVASPEDGKATTVGHGRGHDGRQVAADVAACAVEASPARAGSTLSGSPDGHVDVDVAASEDQLVDERRSEPVA